MARVENVLVSSTRAYEATGADGSAMSVKNAGPDSCFYGSSSVSSASNEGTLTSGQSLAFLPSKFFISAGTSNLQVTATVPSPVALDPTARGLGFQSWSHDPLSAPANTAPTAGTVYGTGLYLNQGQVATNVLFNPVTAGAGTAPTSIFVGLCSSTVMLRKSADVTASTVWTTAGTTGSIPLSSPVTIPASGLYYVLFLQVGSWSVTQHTMGRAAIVPVGTPNALLSAALFATSQTTLPADGASPGTPTNPSSLRYWVGVS